jgi:putative transposase
MRKSKFSESKIVSLLKEAEAGRKVSDICREHGISNNTFFISGVLSLAAWKPQT